MAFNGADQRLDGWKSIARHLGRDERTVKRWEARGLPVHRVPGGARAPVYAVVGEIDRWLTTTDPTLMAEPAEPLEPADGAPHVGGHDSDPADRRDRPTPRSGSEMPVRWRRARIVVLAAGGAAALAALAFASDTRDPSPPLEARAPRSIAAHTPMLPIDPGAREHYLNGLQAWNLRTPASLAQAREDFGAAIAREPASAPAYAGLANTYLLLREFGAMRDAEAYAKATVAAETALRLDPALAAAHRAHAFALYWGQHRADAAWAEFDRAATLAPGEALTWHWYATALDGAGRSAEAARMIERARALDPGSMAILTDKGEIVYRAGDRAKGRAILERVLALDPGNIDAHRNLARIAVAEGRSADAKLHWQRVIALGGSAEVRSALTDMADASAGARERTQAVQDAR